MVARSVSISVDRHDKRDLTFYSPATSLIAGFATFGAGFAVRPFGAVVFGRIGDLIGRKFAFVLTVTLMGGSTVAVGLLPTYASIGILALSATSRACSIRTARTVTGESGHLARDRQPVELTLSRFDSIR